MYRSACRHLKPQHIHHRKIRQQSLVGKNKYFCPNMGTQVDDKETQYAQVEVRLLLRDVSKGMRSFSGSLRGRFRMIRLVVRRASFTVFFYCICKFLPSSALQKLCKRYQRLMFARETWLWCQSWQNLSVGATLWRWNRTTRWRDGKCRVISGKEENTRMQDSSARALAPSPEAQTD